MSGRRAIVIAVDGLRASALGAYGNTWQPTPAFDALASRAVVVEWMYRQSPELEEFYHTAWGGALPREIAAAGGVTALFTDDADVAARGEAAGIVDVLQLELPEPAATDDVSETMMARLFAVAASQLEQLDRTDAHRDRLLWVHARAFHGPWDAPHALRVGLLDEDEIAAPEFVDAPACEQTGDHDIVLGYRAAYAAQAMVLDDCVGGLLAAAEGRGDDETLFAVVGCRGFALGEHGAVGGRCLQLYGELLHVPCLIAATRLAPAPPRWPRLATVADLGATLAAWFGLPARVGSRQGVDLLSWDSPLRQYVVAAGMGGERSIRTPEWYLRKPAESGAELFVKPDDRWEANEIADRRPEVAEALLAALERIAREPESTAFEPPPELAADAAAGLSR
jgi:hypothetical protein